MSEARLALERVACVRGDRLLFAGLDLVLGPGEAAMVVGPNGAGKSSLLRLIAGLLAPAAGAVRREGGVALVGEAPALDPALPLARALGFWAAIDAVGASAVARALSAMAIAPLADVPVRLLSTGQRKRAALAGAIAGARPIWLLDEPANGLDAAALTLLADAIAAHRANGGIVVAASHQPIGLADAREIALASLR